ncbi:hypothetical protein EV182_008124 [Spiromyces aspiralis]|uniref:Uncharacterized protein n=1 Tax=Spiromyces aspiralis TaxID=68401 RepID=A0ACC1HMU3_9FUNG|nr:hypothetical protein EV182_008124 [Spiromyces aspiralis]
MSSGYFHEGGADSKLELLSVMYDDDVHSTPEACIAKSQALIVSGYPQELLGRPHAPTKALETLLAYDKLPRSYDPSTEAKLLIQKAEAKMARS